MRTHWTIGGGDTLLLFFNGWGMDGGPTAHLETGGFDVCICCGYEDLTVDDSTLARWKTYTRIKAAAWSMGVWAAERVLPAYGLMPERAIALNGTPFPVDDRYGIPCAVAQGTYENLSPQTLKKFYRRVFGGTAASEAAGAGFPAGALEERRRELGKILAAEEERRTENAGETLRCGIRWNRAFVSRHDSIFPPGNLLAYWQGRCEVTLLDAPHNPFACFKRWEEIVGEG